MLDFLNCAFVVILSIGRSLLCESTRNKRGDLSSLLRTCTITAQILIPPLYHSAFVTYTKHSLKIEDHTCLTSVSPASFPLAMCQKLEVEVHSKVLLVITN